MAKPKYKKPTHEQLDCIARQITGKAVAHQWMVQRCPSRDFKFMREFELKGDFSHSKDKHWCGECQCTQKAGAGTKGNFWGEGPEWYEVGHYGVGFCAEHEKVARDRGCNVMEVAIKHKEALQSGGKLTTHDPSIIAKHEADVSQRKIKMVQNMEYIQSYLEEFIEFMQKTKKREDHEIQAGIEAMTDRIDEFDFNEDKDRKKFKRELEDLILVASSLTESSGGRVIPMTDKTKLTELRNFVKDISKLNLDEYRMGKDSYVHVDEVRTRIPKMMSIFDLVLRKVYEFHLSYDQEKDDFKQFLDDMKDNWKQENFNMWSSMKLGQK